MSYCYVKIEVDFRVRGTLAARNYAVELDERKFSKGGKWDKTGAELLAIDRVRKTNSYKTLAKNPGGVVDVEDITQKGERTQSQRGSKSLVNSCHEVIRLHDELDG